MAVSLFESHRPREASITVSLSPDFSGDYVAPGAADDVTINAAIVAIAALGGGEVVLGYGDFALTATVSVPANVMLHGIGWETVLNYDAGGNCITITGDNVKIRDLKIIITAGAGAGGTRPNGIFATGRTNLEIVGIWEIGDQTVGDDGSASRQNGINFDATCTDCRTVMCRFDGNHRCGIRVSSSLSNLIEGNYCEDNTRYGLFVVTSSNYAIIKGNNCSYNVQIGILVSSTCIKVTIVSNMVQRNGYDGLAFSDSNKSTIVGNDLVENGRHGISLIGGDNNTVIGNVCNDNDFANTGTYDGINITGDDNIVMGNICNDNDRWGIMITADGDSNLVKNNQLQGNTSGPFNDAGTNTKLAVIPLEFNKWGGGSGGLTAPVINTSPGGIDIDADNEFAYVYTVLPEELQQVVRIKIWAYSNVIEATNNMLLRLVAHGATSSELWSGNAIDVANEESIETGGIVQYDVIHWVFTVADDAQIGTLAAQDYMEIMAIGEAAAAPDIATDALFGVVEIEYV